MRRPLGVMAAAAAALLLSACGAEVNEGTAVGKEYRPMETWTDYVAQWNGKGTTMVPVTQIRPECYAVTLDNGNDVDDVCVSPAEYERVKIGDYYKVR